MKIYTDARKHPPTVNPYLTVESAEHLAILDNIIISILGEDEFENSLCTKGLF